MLLELSISCQLCSYRTFTVQASLMMIVIMIDIFFVVKAAGLTGWLFCRLVLQRKEILEQLETEEEREEHRLEWKKHGNHRDYMIHT